MDLEIFTHKRKIILLSGSNAFDTVGGLKSAFLLAPVQIHIPPLELVFCML